MVDPFKYFGKKEASEDGNFKVPDRLSLGIHIVDQSTYTVRKFSLDIKQNLHNYIVH
jgi:hypothetical protein